MKRHFIKFLKEEGIYEEYRFYVNERNGNSSLRDILFGDKEKLSSSSIYYENLIMSAFTWSYTSEGVNFWSSIHTKWIFEARKLKNKKLC